MDKQRLHHYKKEILTCNDVVYSKLSTDAKSFLEYVETTDRELSTNKWKKLYATLAELNQITYSNYRIYQTRNGTMYDVTTHQLITPQELEAEQTQQEVEDNLFNDNPAGQLKRCQFELKQIDIKIASLQAKRRAVVDRQNAVIERL